jgi:hypothetical protein
VITLNSFHPNKLSFTLILSSPAHFVAECGSEKFFLTHAWRTFGAGLQDFDLGKRYSRNFFALTFRERERSGVEDKERQPPHYSYVGDYFSIFLSLYFGKRFENHGFLLDHGHYCLPNVQPPQPLKSHAAPPFTANPRKDLNIPLRFDEATPLIPLLDQVFVEVHGTGQLSQDLLLAFTAGRFYQQALQQYDSDPELSFLSLVNAGEVLVSGWPLTETDLTDEDLTAMIAEIDMKLSAETALALKKKFFGQISRKFRKGLSKSLNEHFYLGSESTEEFLCLKPENVEKHLKAAYALRSRFLHAGARFGNWVSLDYQGAEISIGTPAVGDPEWKKLISAIPTLGGLERVIRFAVLRFIHQRISPLHAWLD